MKQITKDLLNKKYFIFDIDGTLIDSMGMWNLVDQMVILNQTGVEVPLMDIKIFRDSVLYDNQNMQGDIYQIYYAEAIKQFGVPLTVEEFAKQRSEMSSYLSINELDYKQGAGEFLLALKDLRKTLGVVSTTTTRQYEKYKNQNKKIREKAPLSQLMDAVILCEDVLRKKPDPEGYLKAISILGAKPEECVVFEDSFNGVLAAKNAGLEVVAVYDEFAANEQDLIEKITDYKVDTFSTLMNILGLNKPEHQVQPQL